MARQGWCSTQIYQPVKHLVQTSEDRDLVDALGHVFQRFELLHAQGNGVALHHLGGVEQRTRRCRFFTPTDHIGLGRLLGLDHLGEDGLHLARQHDVLHAHAVQLDAVGRELGAHVCGHDLVDRRLVLQQLVQRARADGRTRAKLQTITKWSEANAAAKPGVDAATEITAKLAPIEARLVQVKMAASEDNLRYPNMLNEQYDTFSATLDSEDFGPTDSQRQVYAYLHGELSGELSKWRAVSDHDLPELQSLMRARGVP